MRKMCVMGAYEVMQNIQWIYRLHSLAVFDDGDEYA